MSNKIISIKNLSYAYQNEENQVNTAIDNISLDVNKGDFITILGHNGSGKSTLAKLLCGILTPEKGMIEVGGLDVSEEANLMQIRQTIGMVFQNPDNQIVATIVEEDVAFAPENLGLSREEIRKRVDYALNAVNIAEFKSHAPHLLSGGQKQRVAIAGILAMKPSVIVLDEATAMLDPSGREDVMNTVRTLNKEEGITVIHITHYMEEAIDSDRVIVMNKGKVVFDDKPECVFSNVEEMKEIGLDVPQVTQLLFLLNKSGYSFDAHIINEEKCEDAIVNYYNNRLGITK